MFVVTPAKAQEGADPVVGGKEALRLASRLEGLRLPLSSPGRAVRVLRPVVEPLVLPVLDGRHRLALGRPVARQRAGDPGARCPALPLGQLDWSPGVLGTLCATARRVPCRVSASTGSVKVPPMSTPTRTSPVFSTVSDLFGFPTASRQPWRPPRPTRAPRRPAPSRVDTC